MAKTLPLSCVSTAFVAKTLPLPAVPQGVLAGLDLLLPVPLPYPYNTSAYQFDEDLSFTAAPLITADTMAVALRAETVNAAKPPEPTPPALPPLWDTAFALCFHCLHG